MVIGSVSSGSAAPARWSSAVLFEKEKAVYEMQVWVEFRRVLLRSCSATETVIEPVVEARLPPSLAVAVTDRVKLGSSAEVAVMVRPASCAGVSVQLPPPLDRKTNRLNSRHT